MCSCRAKREASTWAEHYQLLNGTMVLAMSIAQVDESKTGEGERVCLPS